MSLFVTVDPVYLIELGRKVNTVRGRHPSAASFVKYMAEAMKDGWGWLFVDLDDERKMVAGAAVTLQRAESLGNAAWLDFAWSEQKALSIENLAAIERFVKEVLKVDILRIEVKRGFDALQREYGFAEISRVMEKKL